MGDFNIDLMRTTKSSERLVEDTIFHGFIQRVRMPTRTTDNTNSLIDHVYTKTRNHPFTDIIQSDISDHYITITTFPTKLAKIKKQMITKRWFKGDSYSQIQEILTGEDWSVIHSMDAESSTNHLIGKIQEAMDIVVPVETKELKKRPINQWTTPGIKISLKRAAKLYRKYKS